MMNADIKRAWVEALRSGLYRQGRQKLVAKREGEEEMRYCCLGVLCELAEKAGVVAHHDREAEVPNPGYSGWVRGTVRYYGPKDREEEAGILPREVAEWAGLAMRNPRVTGRFTGSRSLSGYNDDGFTFETIADLIEEHL